MLHPYCPSWKALDPHDFAGWSSAPGTLALPDSGMLHLWLFSLQQLPSCVMALAPLLTDDERERAARFRTLPLRHQYIVGRAVLRVLLADYLGIAAESVALRYGARGKPYLADQGLVFNLAHSETLALLAISAQGALGVDLEAIRLIPDLERVAASFFSPAERADLFSLPAEQHPQAFYRCWTRKEAYIKAESSGLHLPLDSFDVTLLPSDPVRLRRIGSDLQPDRQWSLIDVPISGAFRAAAALDAPITHTCRWLVG